MQKKLSVTIDRLLANTGDMALRRRAREILKGLSAQKNNKILDIGCGDGYYLYLLSGLKLKLDLTGVDNDLLGLQSAKRNLVGKKVRLVRGDVSKRLPFAANSFDKIVMSEVAEHLPDDLKDLKEVHRVLKPGGILCLTVPNHNYPVFWDPINWVLEHLFKIHIKSGFWAGLWNNHIRLYTPNEITSVVKKAGFKVQEVKSTTFWSIPFGHNIVNLGAILLHSGKMDKSIAESVNKFKKPAARDSLVKIYFWIVEIVDKLNGLWTPHSDWGVGVFVKALK